MNLFIRLFSSNIFFFSRQIYDMKLVESVVKNPLYPLRNKKVHTHTHMDEMWLTGQRSTGTCCPETSCWGGSDFQSPPSTIGRRSLSETDLLKHKSHFTIQPDIHAHSSPLYFQQTPNKLNCTPNNQLDNAHYCLHLFAIYLSPYIKH